MAVEPKSKRINPDTVPIIIEPFQRVGSLYSEEKTFDEEVWKDERYWNNNNIWGS